MTATNADGTNTGVTELNDPIALSTTLTTGPYGVREWSLQGAGTLVVSTITDHVSATYTPPATMPANSNVVITCYLKSYPSITVSYSLVLTSNIPVITAVSPTQLLTGGTQTVTFTGSTFVPATTVTQGGTALAVTYISPTQLSAQIPVSATATGSLSVVAQNPGQGGGASAAFAVPIAVNTITVTPSQTGRVVLGNSLTMTSTVAGSSQTAVTWSVNGTGTITTAGIYTAPAAMPSGNDVVTATLVSNPAITGSYTVSLANPVPAIASVNPAQLQTGGPQTLTVTGSNFLAGTTVTLGGTALTTTYNSGSSLTVQAPVSNTATGSLKLVAQNPTPGGGSSASFPIPVTTNTISVAPTSQGGGSLVLGNTLSLAATVTGSLQTAVTWSVSGGGSISTSGLYTAPATMPSGNVVVTATLADNTAITGTYQVPLSDPVPTVTEASPTQLLVGSTTTVTVTGTGLLPNTTVTMGGTTLATTYSSPTQLSVQVPVPATATAPLTLQVQNPGVSTVATFTETVSTATLVVSTSSLSGSNPTLALGSTASFAATVTGSAKTAVTWSVTGGGTISGSGNYTAPSSMPASNQVTVVGTLTSNTTVIGTYLLNLDYPVPQITKTAPSYATAGATIAITLSGTNFQPGISVLVNGVAAPTTYTSATSITAQISAPSGSSAALSLLPQNPSPMIGTSTAYALTTQVLLLAVTNADGSVNNGQAPLGAPVYIGATAVNSPYGGKTWSLQGPGTITPNSAGDYYTAPTTMPSSNTATITVSMTSYSAMAASYTVTLVDPLPLVTSASPTQLLTGGTQTVALKGTGFLPGTVVTLNGAALAATYNSYTSLTVQVPVGNAASGSLNLVVQNPTPGGGAATYSIPIEANTIKLTPITQTGPAIPLNTYMGINASVAGSLQTAVTWSLSGAGSLSTSGVYTAPATLPSGNVVVTATLVSNPAITASTYPLTITNPVPSVNGANPSQAAQGGTIPMVFNGGNFLPSTVILVNGTAVPTTYMTSSTLTAQVAAPAGSASNLMITAQNPAPGGGTSTSAFQLPVATLQLTAVNSDGTNTGTARLGVPVSFSSVDTDTAHATRTWTLQGAGTLTSSGTNAVNATYTPPQVMPSNAAVTVTSYLSSLPQLTTSYTMTLVNSVPSVATLTPSQLLTGGTQAVALSGTGFVAGTTVTLNGTTLATTYIDYADASVQVPVGATATGTLNFQIQNPTPGGGSTAFTESIQPNSIALTAADADGTNTGTAELGVTVAVSATVTGSAQTAVTWSLTGPGSLSTAGVYTAPSAMPGSQAVTITATLVSNPAINASYRLNIINPLPTVTAATPDTVPAGATTTVTFVGTGFVPSTVVEVNGAAVPTTYVSATSIQAQITAAAAATGSLPVQAYTSAFTGGLSDFYPLAISSPISATEAGRLLDQTTFGPTTSLIQHVQQEGATAWLAEQFNTPETVLPVVPVSYPAYCGDSEHCVVSEWWQTVLSGNDQLRQRVAFALSELFVVSSNDVTGFGIQYYHNLLAADAFSNWYTIMNDVTLSPAMGIYLNMVNSRAATTGNIANENFARENMQLFNMGLDLINQDGSLQLDSNGNPIPAYTEAQVQAFARVFTGWTFANTDGSTPNSLNNPVNFYNQLVAVEPFHDETSKAVLSGVTLPSGQTAEQDEAQALANVFQHPNVPPFVSQLLIQHLVKSQPSPAYVSRVAAVFTNDGNNVRGNMQAVLTAIFTDPEARAGDTAALASDGHLREPILWLTDVLRGLGFVNLNSNNYYEFLSEDTNVLNEVPYQSPAVFNFFPPDYTIPGTTLTAPEFGLENTASVNDRLTLADTIVNNNLWNFNVDLSATSPLGQILVSQGPAALVSALNNLFLYGTMDSNTATAITNEIGTVTNQAQQVRLAVYLVITSSQYKILH